MNTMIIKLDNI